MDSKGRNIRKATDAKLFDSRDENQDSTARRNQKPRTFRGNNADEFRHAPNSKKGQQRRRPDNDNPRPNKESFKAKAQDSDRKPTKQKVRYDNPNAAKPSQPVKRSGNTLSLKK